MSRCVQIKFERNRRRLLAGIAASSEPIQTLSAEPMSESDSDAIDKVLFFTGGS